MYLSFGGSEEPCDGCIIRFNGAHVYTFTSGTGGSYWVDVKPGDYNVGYACPNPMGGVFWVPIGTLTVPAVDSYWVDIITEGCL